MSHTESQTSGQRPSGPMLTDRARAVSHDLIAPLAGRLGGIGITADMLTVVGTLLHVGVLLVIARGTSWWVCGLALAFAGSFDALDGTLARVTSTTSRFGAFLDSTLDRISEILLFYGLLVRFQLEGDVTAVAWVFAALTGSLMVSYSRARSEGIDRDTRSGILGRFERMLVLIGGMLIGWVVWALAVVAIGAWITVAMRVLDVRRQCEGGALEGAETFRAGN